MAELNAACHIVDHASTALVFICSRRIALNAPTHSWFLAVSSLVIVAKGCVRFLSLTLTSCWSFSTAAKGSRSRMQQRREAFGNQLKLRRWTCP